MKHPAHRVHQCDSFWGGPAEIRKKSADILLDAYANIDKKQEEACPFIFHPHPPPLIQARAAGPSNVEWNSCLITVWVWTRHSLSPPLSDAAERLMNGNNIHRVVCRALIYHAAQVQRKVKASVGVVCMEGGAGVGFSSIG